MRRLLILFTLASYGFAAMELHEWVRVPQVLAHLLEHHSDFGHHHDDAAEHGHGDDENGHNPFAGHKNGVCGAMTLMSVDVDQPALSMTLPDLERALAPIQEDDALTAYTGSKWNPPKLV